ncbi:UNVERIFIED_CONTAM: Pleiotropic drug resistance protein 1, partial [Sesamum radiatum]
MEAFSKSSREADDEEALKWAALEKLPTNLRIRRGIFTEEEGKTREIDIKDLGLVERKNLVERLLRIAEEGNENFLLKLKERILRSICGSRALPTVFNFTVNILEGFLSYLHVLPSRKKPLPILHDVSGIIKPGRMTLLLGPPCSGKTTLLLALAGKLDPELKVSGRVTYNGHEMKEFVPQRTSAYISQNDLHIGEMTVRETLAFSQDVKELGLVMVKMLAELSRREKEANIKPDPDIDIFMKAASIEGQEASVVTDYIIKILGLEVCADTLVGDEMVRGISGGQRKRLTTGEMLVGPARALFMDEISTGLDSSTTFQIVNSIRQSIHILQGTAVISLLQPAPETYNLFDDIILLSDGEIVTSKKDQEQYRIHKDEPYSYVSSKEFSEAFQSFHVGRKLGDELAVPFDKEKSHPDALTTVKYGLILMASISMTVFLRTEMPKKTVTDGGIYMGALFYALIMIMFNGFSELALSILKLPVFYKQRDLLFFLHGHTLCQHGSLKFPSHLLKLPLGGLTYYPTGYDSDAGRFFKQLLLLIVINQMAGGLFRLVGALGRNIIVANTFGSCALLTVLVLGGFILSRDNIKSWWIWGYWFSPLMYGQNAIAVNEFLGKSWSHIPPGATEPVGVSILKARGIFPEARWYWIGLGAIIGYAFLFNFLVTLALTYLNPLGKPQAILSEETLAERTASKRSEPTELSSRGKRTSGNESSWIQEDRLELLKGVSGAFRPGVLTALMGISGAGKTTLMDVLSGRKTGGHIDGESQYQVYESLQFSAWLRLPPEVDAATRKMFIEEVMELVELTPLREALVGLPGVNGLDARAAAIVMRTVRNTVDTGRTVVCTIHQPSIDIFDAFDELLLLKRGGEEIYVGPLGRHSSQLIKYFEGIDGISKIKDGYNPATWMLEVTSEAQEAALGVNFAEVYKNSELYRRNKALIKELSTPAPGSKDLYFQTHYSQSSGHSAWLAYGNNIGRTGETPHTLQKKKQDVFNAMGSMYAAVLFLGVQNATSVQPVVAIERTVFYEKEQQGCIQLCHMHLD